MATHQIVIELDPRNVKAGMAEVDGSLRRSAGEAREFERAAAEAMRAVEKSAREAAREQQRAARVAAKASVDAARQASAAQRTAAREQEEFARAQIIAAERRAEQRQRIEQRVASDMKAAQDKLAQSYRQIVGPAAEYREKLNQIIQLERQGAITAQQRANAVRGMQREMEAHSARQQGGIRGAIGEIASSQFGAIAGPAAVAGLAVEASRKIIELSDAYKQLTNRIRTVTESESEAMMVRSEVIALANRTRTDIGATAEGYTRFAAATKSLKLSQAELLQFTESVNKTIKLSGATTAEAQAGLIQFAQGLGAGALRGDELRSVLEQLGPVADVLAKHLGTTRAGLRQLGEQGKITADVVVAAFAAQREEIDDRFSRSVATFSELWTVFRNNVEDAVGQIVEAVGGMPELTKAFQLAGEAVGNFGHGLALAIKDLKQLIADVPELAGALAMLDKSDVAKALTSSTFGNYAAIRGRVATDDLANAINPGTQSILERVRQNAYFETQQEQLRKFTEQDPAARRAAFEKFSEIGTRLNDALHDEKKAAREAAEAQREHAKAVREAGEAFKKFTDESVEGANRVVGDVADSFRSIKDRVIDATADAVEKERQLLAYRAVIDGINAETEAYKLSDQERARRSELMRIEHDLMANGVQLTEAQRVQLDLALQVQERARAAAEYKGRTLTDQFNEEATRAAKDSQKQMEALASALGGVADGFGAMLREGKKSMSEMATDVALQVAKILAQFALLAGLRHIFGADSGAVSLAKGILSAGNFAGGGTYTVPNNGHGVDGVPLFMRVTPNEQITVTPPGAPAPNQAAPTAPPHVSIVNSVAPAMVHAAMDTPAGHRVIANVIERHIGQLSTMVRRSS